MNNSASLFNEAWNHHEAGRLAHAEQLYRQILQADPDYSDAWCFLGALCHGQGRLTEAESYLRQSVTLFPTNPSAQSYLGMTLALQGKLHEAVASLQQALLVLPDNGVILNNLGLALARQGKHIQAIDVYDQALRLDNSNVLLHYNLGLSLKATGQVHRAIQQFQETLRLQPNFVEAYNDLGSALAEQGNQDDAIANYRQSLRLRPDYADAHYNLGWILSKQNHADQAIRHYEQALQFKPDHIDAHFNLGQELIRRKRPNEAEIHYHQIVRLRPDHARAHLGLGSAFIAQGDLAEAEQSFREAIRLQPDYADAHLFLGKVLQKQYDPVQAIGSYRKALHLCPDLTDARDYLAFCLNFDPEANFDEVFAAHCAWGQQIKPKDTTTEYANEPDADRRLRVGYVSPDLRAHALIRYLEPVLESHDPQQVETYCYAEVAIPDAVTAKLKGVSHHWRSTFELPDSEVANCIRQDGIDILVDLAGFTTNNRLRVFAEKPAPIQATWLGYMNTTGLSTVDYRITDPFLDPPGQPKRDTEEMLRLPNGFCCFKPPADAPAVTPLPARQKGFLTFGSLHGLLKLNTEVLQLWGRVLQALPAARLLMFHETLTSAVCDRIWSQFAAWGIGPERLDLRKGSDAPSYLAIYDEIDVGLDAFPVSGGVSTCESLWMGVPVLSLAGGRPAGRNSAALLARVGLSDWAVESPDAFVRKAEKLPTQLDQLALLRGELRERMAKTICDAKRFTHELEDAYRTIWQRWCEKKRQAGGSN